MQLGSQLTVFAVLTSFLAACGCGASSPTVENTTREEVSIAMGVIITETDAERMVGGLGMDGYAGYWTPERSQVAALERSIVAHLAANAPEGSRLRDGLEGYRAQYFGVLRGDRELILANFFCDDFGRNIETEVVAVDDGGDCYFTVEYDPATDGFSQLMINGEA